MPGHGNEKREDAGCIVTLIHRVTGEKIRRQVHGLIGGALPAFLDKYDARIWKVASISTVNSILTDIRGRDPRAKTPEAVLLSQVGRSEHG